MPYVEVVPTKIDDWYFWEYDLLFHKSRESENIMQNIDFKINANNLSNLTIILLTIPSEETPTEFVNEFIIGKNSAPAIIRTRYGRDGSKILTSVPFSRYTEQDGYIYCGYSVFTPYSQYWTAFVEFPPVPTPTQINVEVINTETF